ncbi:MAG: hypothetical protein C5B55_12945 [Blastocatellia bacterium]|nr:MAG: hypothetical protein C5B55_12945 [Blastocatellia bacterium]
MNWQLLVTGLIVLAAAFYVARRVIQRLKAFSSASAQSSCSGCASSCGQTTLTQTSSYLFPLTRTPKTPILGAQASSPAISAKHNEKSN